MDEDLSEFEARDNIIEDIQVYSHRHSLEKVCLFVDKNFEVKNLSAAFALRDFLIENGIEADVVVSKPSSVKDFYTDLKTKATGRFLGVVIGCKDMSYLDNINYQDTFVLFQVYGPIKTKGYAVLNYTEYDVSCSAEVVYHQIKDYANKMNKKISKNVAQHLYTALVAGTKRYGSNIRPHTFEMAKDLIDAGADYKQANYLCEKKNPIILSIHQEMYKNLVRKDRICYSIIKKDSVPDGTTVEDFKDAIDCFKKTDKIDIWILAVDQGYDYYNVIMQGKEINNFDIKNIAVKNNGLGDHTTGTCMIRANDLPKLISDSVLLMNKTDELIASGKQPKIEDEYDCEDDIEEDDEI